MTYMPNQPPAVATDRHPADSQFLTALARHSPFFARFFGLQVDAQTMRLKERRQRRRHMQQALQRAKLTLSEERIETGTEHGILPKSAVQRLADGMVAAAAADRAAQAAPQRKPKAESDRIGDMTLDVAVDAAVSHGLFGPLTPLVQAVSMARNVAQVTEEMEVMEYHHPRRPGQRVAQVTAMERLRNESMHDAARRTRLEDARRELEGPSGGRRKKPEHLLRLAA